MIVAIIVAAGEGLRMGGPRRKQFLRLDRLPILTHTLKAFDDSPRMDRIVLVAPQNDAEFCQREIIGPGCLNTPVNIVPGGKRRQDSVLNGLRSIQGPETVVLIHDGVRPLVSVKLIEACISGAKRWRACIPAIPVIDTLKKSDSGGRIRRTISRQGLYAAQTPQAFVLSLILKAHEAGLAKNRRASDDASLVEAMGQPVRIIPGERRNIKITTPEDLDLARAYRKSPGPFTNKS